MSSYLEHYSVWESPSGQDAALLERIYDCIVDFKRGHDGVAPTVQEIVDAVGMASKGTANVYLKRLEMDGRIQMIGKGQSRGIMVVGGVWEVSRG